jgi:hypothetical protein
VGGGGSRSSSSDGRTLEQENLLVNALFYVKPRFLLDQGVTLKSQTDYIKQPDKPRQ